MISTEEAKRLNVSGWDVYLSDHIAYVSPVNQDWVASQICSQGLLLARDTAILTMRHPRESEARQWREYLDNGSMLGRDPHPTSTAGLFQLRHWRLDCFKLASAFELALKARLLRAGYVLHLIAPSQQALATKQKREPILISEFRSLSLPQHDGSRNFFPHLTDRTLSFETMLKKDPYIRALSMLKDDKTFFDELRRLRNLIHLPLAGEHVVTPFLSSLGESFLPFLLRCLDVYLITPHNETCLSGSHEQKFSD